jgi:protein deglycase
MPSILVPLADGVEEMEAVIIVDTLRRASLRVVTASIGENRTVTASRGVVLIADELWDTVAADDYDAIVLPGGAGGCERLSKHPSLLETLRIFSNSEKLVAAICAGPLALQAAGILQDRKVTCHPAVASQLTATARSNARVVEDGNLITSQAPGTTFEFALAIITHILGSEAATTVEAGLILP